MKPRAAQVCFDMSSLVVKFDEVGEEACGVIEETGLIVITLGYNCTWRSVIEQLMHELQEIYMLKNGFRFINTKLPNDYESIACVFHLNHDEFQIMIREVSKVFASLLPPLKEEWERLNRKKS